MNNVDRLFGENICTEYHVIICILMLLSLFIHIFNAFFFFGGRENMYLSYLGRAKLCSNIMFLILS